VQGLSLAIIPRHAGRLAVTPCARDLRECGKGARVQAGTASWNDAAGDLSGYPAYGVDIKHAEDRGHRCAYHPIWRVIWARLWPWGTAAFYVLPLPPLLRTSFPVDGPKGLSYSSLHLDIPFQARTFPM